MRADYADRRVEITGPTDRKLVINALNSGARGFMADFEDANSPTWRNQVDGQLNLLDAVGGRSLCAPTADTTSWPSRPRCWSAPGAGTCEETSYVDGKPVAGGAAGLRPLCVSLRARA